MLEKLRDTLAYAREKQLLHKLGVVVSIAVIAVACYMLYHMLKTLRRRLISATCLRRCARPHGIRSCWRGCALRPAISR